MTGVGNAGGAAQVRDGCDAHVEALPLRVDRREYEASRQTDAAPLTVVQKNFRRREASKHWPGLSSRRSL